MGEEHDNNAHMLSAAYMGSMFFLLASSRRQILLISSNVRRKVLRDASGNAGISSWNWIMGCLWYFFMIPLNSFGEKEDKSSQLRNLKYL